uniref:Uncharacterized protein n=1 Tax=viral metagenome TaxID=1070528 RepID=A0A6M3LHL5_9ZZZZ
MYEDEENDGFAKRGKTFVDVKLAEDWQYPARVKRIRLADVIRYYHRDARNITSGMRSIAGIHGDWRQIDYIAGDCLAYFKHVNRPALAREGRKFGMELR